ncbi:hypothetical protein L1887_62017 [Cichorium endivia]|nr:hypothetical protein L1887_62017 [Cichorium endivia]
MRRPRHRHARIAAVRKAHLGRAVVVQPRVRPLGRCRERGDPCGQGRHGSMRTCVGRRAWEVGRHRWQRRWQRRLERRDEGKNTLSTQRQGHRKHSTERAHSSNHHRFLTKSLGLWIARSLGCRLDYIRPKSCEDDWVPPRIQGGNGFGSSADLGSCTSIGNVPFGSQRLWSGGLAVGLGAHWLFGGHVRPAGLDPVNHTAHLGPRPNRFCTNLLAAETHEWPSEQEHVPARNRASLRGDRLTTAPQ